MKNKNIRFIIIAVAIAIVFAVGLTYAYFSADVSNTVNVNATAETKARDIFIASGDVTLETEVTNVFMQDDDGDDDYIDSIEKSGTITVSLTAGSDTATCKYDLAISNSGSIAYTKSPNAGDLFEYTVQGTDDSEEVQSFAEINVDDAMASTKSATTAQDSSKQTNSGILGNYSISDDYDEGTQAATTQTWTIKTKFYNLNKIQDDQAGMNYSYDVKVVNVNCTNKEVITANATTNYTGYYADTDGDGTADGIIYADLLKSANNNQDSVSGVWENSSGSQFTYNTITTSKVYNISENYYYGKPKLGVQQIISIIPNSDGKDRFYVMALDDISTNTYAFNYNYSSNKFTLDSQYMEPSSSPYLMHDSDGQSLGRRNTNLLMKETLLTGNSNNLWNYISDQVKGGWFVPSRAEWAAFGDFINKYLYITSFTDSTKYGISTYYWSSSMKSESYGWRASLQSGCTDFGYLNQKYSIRLATTF